MRAYHIQRRMQACVGLIRGVLRFGVRHQLIVVAHVLSRTCYGVAQVERIVVTVAVTVVDVRDIGVVVVVYDRRH